MNLKRKIVVFGCGWLALISALHTYLNVNWPAVLNDYRPAAKRKTPLARYPLGPLGAPR
jgi:NitT/TauT family transport system substrate-binding protein